MKLIPKVNRTYYRRMRQGDLGDFVMAVVDHVENNQRYNDLTAEIAALKAKGEAYVDALQKAQLGGHDRITRKNVSKEEVYSAMNEFSDGVDFFAKGDVTYVTDCGMKPRIFGNKYEGDLFPPYDVAARSNGFPGAIVVSFNIDPVQMPATQKIAFEWSGDNGTTWTNGRYGSDKAKFTVQGLPSGQTILIRVRCIGTRNRVSEWCLPVPVTVA